jgi:hypothetical protein
MAKGCSVPAASLTGSTTMASSRRADTHVHGPDCSHDQPATEPIRRAALKVGRNDPCLCASGRKYKKCHGAAVVDKRPRT